MPVPRKRYTKSFYINFMADQSRWPEAQGAIKFITSAHKRVGNAVNTATEIGERLHAIKDAIGYGHWNDFLFQCRVSRTHAHRYMTLARAKDVPIWEQLPPSTRAELAAPSTPESVREAVAADLEKGETPTLEEIKRRKAAAKAPKTVSLTYGGTNNTESPAEISEPEFEESEPPADNVRHLPSRRVDDPPPDRSFSKRDAVEAAADFFKGQLLPQERKKAVELMQVAENDWAAVADILVLDDVVGEARQRVN